jgi:hypothetical protein
MLPLVTFLLGLVVGLLPILRRSLDSIRWAALSRWAIKRGVYSKELSEDEIIGRLKESPRPSPTILRRAK